MKLETLIYEIIFVLFTKTNYFIWSDFKLKCKDSTILKVNIATKSTWM